MAFGVNYKKRSMGFTIEQNGLIVSVQFGKGNYSYRYEKIPKGYGCQEADLSIVTKESKNNVTEQFALEVYGKEKFGNELIISTCGTSIILDNPLILARAIAWCSTKTERKKRSVLNLIKNKSVTVTLQWNRLRQLTMQILCNQKPIYDSTATKPHGNSSLESFMDILRTIHVVLPVRIIAELVGAVASNSEISISYECTARIPAKIL